MLCSCSSAPYRCLDCSVGQRLFCHDCCLQQHKSLPFHHLKRWNGTFFDWQDLGDLGSVIYLGHDGIPCPGHVSQETLDDAHLWDEEDADEEVSDEELLLGMDDSPVLNRDGIIFVDQTGIYKRRVQWCICPNAPPFHIQLLRMRFFPASLKRPLTAFTFDVLDQFNVEAMECKTAARNFYSKLQRMTNNSNPFSVPVSYCETFCFLITDESNFKD